MKWQRQIKNGLNGKWVKSKTKFDGIKEMQCRAETRRDQLTQTSWNEMLTGSGKEWFNTNWKFWSDSNYWSYRSHNPHCSSTVPTQVFFNQDIKTICPFTQTWNKLQHCTFWKSDTSSSLITAVIDDGAKRMPVETPVIVFNSVESYEAQYYVCNTCLIFQAVIQNYNKL